MSVVSKQGWKLFLMLVRLNPSLHLFLRISREHHLIIWAGWPILIWMRSHKPSVKQSKPKPTEYLHLKRLEEEKD